MFGGVRDATGCTRAIANDQAYTDDEQKHWFDKNDYRWLRERGVCTRPALGIYIETNPISHYVLDLSLPSRFSVYACDIKVYLHTT